MRRREFLKLAATTSAGAVLFTGCGVGDGDPEREFDIQSPVNNPEDVAFGRDAWYATAQPVSAGGSNLIVRIYEGRAKKVEGNPDSPLNRGRSSALDQSLVQEVYHPDRVASPMRRRGDRGSGDYEAIASWDDALSQLTTAVSDARGQAGSIVLVTEPVSGSLTRVVTAFADAVGARHMVFEPDEYVVLREAMRQVFGTDRLPTIDLANSRFVLSFSAEFLHNWIAPVQLGIGYGEFRHGPDRPRGLYYHVGPQLSATASNADRWFPIVPGAEGLVALAMAQAMVDEGLVDAGRASAIYGNLDQFTPENVAPATGLSADQIRELARSFGSEQPAVAIAGTSAAAHTNGLFNVAAVFALNYLVGSVGVPGGLMLNPGSPDEANLPSVIGGAPYRDWEALASDMTNGAVQVLLVHGANPVYGLPAASGFQGALGNVPTVVSFSSFMDETAAQADLILPDHTTLESWGLHVPDPGPGYPLVALQQPVVNPFVNSRAFGDVLISVASQLGEPLPWGSYEEAVRGLADGLRGGRGNIDANDPKEFFVTMQTQGGWWDETATPASAPTSPNGTISPADPQFAGDPNDFPFYLLPFPTNALDYGQFAHLPWLQGLPEPISTNVWSTWVEVNPGTGNDLGVATGDVVLVETPNGSFEVPVYINPAAARDVLLIPMGQGHRFYTRYAEQRGANPFEILAPQTDSATGALAWAATRVRISTVGRKVRIPRFEGSVPAYQLEEFPIIQVTGPSGA